MINPETLALTFGLTSAVAWGAGDFSGGFATRQSPVLTVIFISQVIGGALLTALAILRGTPLPGLAFMAAGALAGIFGMSGLICLYKGLAVGRMGIVAPLSAVITALVPVTFAFFTEGAPRILQMAGFAVALVAVWCLAAADGRFRINRQELLLSLAAGGGFGLFFILIDQASQVSVLWPLVAARTASLALIGAILVLRGQPLALEPRRLPLMALAGVLDTAGNAFFALAAQMGRLDVAAVLSSLYPMSTVLLARYILKEHLRPQQWAGVLAAVSAMVLVAV